MICIKINGVEHTFKLENNSVSIPESLSSDKNSYYIFLSAIIQYNLKSGKNVLVENTDVYKPLHDKLLNIENITRVPITKNNINYIIYTNKNVQKENTQSNNTETNNQSISSESTENLIDNISNDRYYSFSFEEIKEELIKRKVYYGTYFDSYKDKNNKILTFEAIDGFPISDESIESIINDGKNFTVKKNKTDNINSEILFETKDGYILKITPLNVINNTHKKSNNKILKNINDPIFSKSEIKYDYIRDFINNENSNELLYVYKIEIISNVKNTNNSIILQSTEFKEFYKEQSTLNPDKSVEEILEYFKICKSKK